MRKPEAVAWEPRAHHVVLGLLLVVAVVIAAVVMLQTGGHGSYRATIQHIIPDGSSQVIVGIEVKNLGASPAAPTCQVEMSSAASAFTGVGTIKANKPIRGGFWADYSVMIPVTTDGATRVNFNASSVSCY